MNKEAYRRAYMEGFIHEMQKMAGMSPKLGYKGVMEALSKQREASVIAQQAKRARQAAIAKKTMLREDAPMAEMTKNLAKQRSMTAATPNKPMQITKPVQPSPTPKLTAQQHANLPLRPGATGPLPKPKGLS